MNPASRGSVPGEAAPADCRLLVPMRVQVLTVKAGDKRIRWVDLTPQYRLLGRQEPATLGYSLKPNFFDASRTPPGPGIHLHWTLPTAFAHIDQEQGKPAAFRAVPNRWLVLRLWQSPNKLELKQRAWVVESDHLGSDGTNPWVTSGGDPTRLWADKKIGHVLDLSSYKEKSGASFLTAVAPGNLAFSSFYPSCKNVFGFHDDHDLEQDVTYSYLVSGWFTDASSELLAGSDDWSSRMNKLGWSVPEGTTSLPTRILCHGAVQGVSWPPPDADRAVPQFEVAVGNSVLDAIAAFVDQATASEGRERERLLGQLQFAVLQDRPPTAEELASDLFPKRSRLTPLRARLHDKMFTALPGGTRWEIDRPGRESDREPKNDRPFLELPDELAEMMRKINRDQSAWDRQQRELTGLRRDLYAQWYKARLLPDEQFRDPSVRTQLKDALGRRIDKIVPAVEALQHSQNVLKAEIEGTARAMRAEFSKRPDWRGHVLIERPMPRYWRSNDPTLLIAGLEIRARADELACRVTGQTVSSLVARDVTKFGDAWISADDLKNRIPVLNTLSSAVPEAIRNDVAGLVCEALLLDPQRARLLAWVAYHQQKGREPSPDEISSLAAALDEAQKNQSGEHFYLGGQSAASGAAARSAFRSALWATATRPWPWTPVSIVWKARYLHWSSDPAQGGLSSWRFDRDDVDYAWRGPTPTARDGPDYQGFGPLSDSVGRGTSKQNQPSGQKQTYLTEAFDFEALTGGSFAVQSMGGFTDALSMQDATIQLPPLKEKSLTIDDHILHLVGDQYAIAPARDKLNEQPSKFFPIRAGHLDIRRLWLVDTFGRTRRLIEKDQAGDGDALAPPLHISRSLRVPGNTELVRLPPRLVQPSRLLFRWLSAETDQQEFLGDLATQPICGWVLPNRLDLSLLICDAAGKALGAVQSVIRPGGWDDRGIRWSKLPLAPVDSDVSAADPRPSPQDVPNRHLRGFVNGLLDLANEKAGAFHDLLELIARMDEIRQPPPEGRNLSVLVGQPLALVRSSLRLDLMGPPATDQSWSQLTTSTPASFTQVPFGVRLGDRRKGPDGLCGYFVADDYGTFHLGEDLPLRASARIGPYFNEGHAIPVTCDPSQPATLLTVLVDPRMGVHISSGILPTKVIGLPPDLVSAALSTLEVPFLVAPVLGERSHGGVPNIPLPTAMPGSWKWTWRPAANARPESAPITSETAPARSLSGTMALYEGWLSFHRKGGDRT